MRIASKPKFGSHLATAAASREHVAFSRLPWTTARATECICQTADVYRSLIRRHLVPRLGQIPLGQLDTATVREWRAGLLEAGVSSTMVAKSYRLLRAICCARS
jgi:hypothetical protein